MLRFTDALGDIHHAFNSATRRRHAGNMPTDIVQEDDRYTLRFDLPGVDADDVDVTVAQDLLTVTVFRTDDAAEDGSWLVRERPVGTYRRRVRLGGRLDTSDVTADYHNGVLTVTFPIREDAGRRNVAIAVGSPSREAITVEAAS